MKLKDYTVYVDASYYLEGVSTIYMLILSSDLRTMHSDNLVIVDHMANLSSTTIEVMAIKEAIKFVSAKIKDVRILTIKTDQYRIAESYTEHTLFDVEDMILRIIDNTNLIVKIEYEKGSHNNVTPARLCHWGAKIPARRINIVKKSIPYENLGYLVTGYYTNALCYRHKEASKLCEHDTTAWIAKVDVTDKSIASKRARSEQIRDIGYIGRKSTVPRIKIDWNISLGVCYYTIKTSEVNTIRIPTINSSECTFSSVHKNELIGVYEKSNELFHEKSIKSNIDCVLYILSKFDPIFPVLLITKEEMLPLLLGRYSVYDVSYKGAITEFNRRVKGGSIAWQIQKR